MGSPNLCSHCQKPVEDIHFDRCALCGLARHRTCASPVPTIHHPCPGCSTKSETASEARKSSSHGEWFQHRHIRLFDEIFDRLRGSLGNDLEAYRNHALRVAAFSLQMFPGTEEEQYQVVIASCFHDAGIWPGNSLDYLAPSAALARKYLTEARLESWIPLVERMIIQHHKVRPADEKEHPLVEIFRKADLVDVTLGIVKGSLQADAVRRVRAEYPNCGFHQRLVKLAARWILRNPTRPFPFLRW